MNPYLENKVIMKALNGPFGSSVVENEQLLRLPQPV